MIGLLWSVKWLLGSRNWGLSWSVKGVGFGDWCHFGCYFALGVPIEYKLE